MTETYKLPAVEVGGMRLTLEEVPTVGMTIQYKLRVEVPEGNNSPGINTCTATKAAKEHLNGDLKYEGGSGSVNTFMHTFVFRGSDTPSKVAELTFLVALLPNK